MTDNERGSIPDVKNRISAAIVAYPRSLAQATRLKSERFMKMRFGALDVSHLDVILLAEPNQRYAAKCQTLFDQARSETIIANR
jgi:hypothetical protein